MSLTSIRATCVVQAQGDAKCGDQNTDGSKGIRLLLNTMREAGATARHMLLTAAAQRWKVAPSACHTPLLAAARSGWGSPLPARHGRGIAAHRSFLIYVAAVAQVAVADDGSVIVPRVDLAADSGMWCAPIAWRRSSRAPSS